MAKEAYIRLLTIISCFYIYRVFYNNLKSKQTEHINQYINRLILYLSQKLRKWSGYRRSYIQSSKVELKL